MGVDYLRTKRNLQLLGRDGSCKGRTQKVVGCLERTELELSTTSKLSRQCTGKGS